MKARRVHVLSCRITMVLCLLLQMAGCGLLEQRSPGQGNPQRPAPAARPLEPQQAERLRADSLPPTPARTIGSSAFKGWRNDCTQWRIARKVVDHVVRYVSPLQLPLRNLKGVHVAVT
jgi:hypothetical protein